MDTGSNKMVAKITVSPITYYPECKCSLPISGFEKEEHDKNNHMPITYWGIYMDGKDVSYTSSRELAEMTKVWIEKWLAGRL